MIFQCDIEFLRQLAAYTVGIAGSYIFYRVFIFKAAGNSVISLLERIAVAAEKIADKPAVLPDGTIHIPIDRKETQK